jgi:hypothetical protein
MYWTSKTGVAKRSILQLTTVTAFTGDELCDPEIRVTCPLGCSYSDFLVAVSMPYSISPLLKPRCIRSKQ